MPIPRAVINNPGRIIAQAKRTGMVALLHMLKRGDDLLPGLYKRSLRLWRGAWAESQQRKRTGDPDYFIPICNVERYLRKNHHKMIFNTTASYGSTEVNRVYSWDEGTIGPMNSLLNMAGSRLRFLAMTRYPFSTPIPLTYEYTMRDGTVKTNNEGYGYSGSNRSIKVVLSHPALQPLDFVDMIRAPVNEMCRQCFIYSVFGKTATPYISLLIYKLRPFLDYIYTRSGTKTSSKLGMDGYIEKLDGILDEVIDRIRAHHGTRSGHLKRVTHGISDDILSGQVQLEFDDIIPETMEGEEYEELKRLVNDEKIIDHRDFSRIEGMILTSAGSSGTQTHRRISWGFPRPASASAAVLGGDFHARLKEGYSLCANVPVWGGQGVADFVLYVRQRTLPEIENERHAQGIWKSVMVWDLKSKSSFDLGIVGRKLGTGTQKVTDEIIRKRRCSDDEWDTIIEHTPSKKESKQLDSYANGLVSDYQRLTRNDSNINSTIIQAILVVDDTELPSTIRKHIQGFAVSTYEKIQSELLAQHTSIKKSDPAAFPKSVYEIEDSPANNARVAVVIKPFEIPQEVRITEALPYPSELPAFHSIQLFTNRIPDSRHFILYVSASGSGSRKSASWIARYWNGIEYARKTFHKQKHKRALWLDLAGEFSNPTIRRAFLRRHAYYSPLYPGEQKQRRYLREFTKKIDFEDISGLIEGALLQGNEFPSTEFLEDKTQGYDMIIVSGMDTLWKILPLNVRGLLQTLTVHLAEATNNEDSTTIWFDSAIPTADTSEFYKQHRVRLMPYNSPLQVYVDEVILNHHIPPLKGISESPFVDEIRRLIKFTPEGYKELGFVVVPPLRNWSKRFRSEVTPERKTPQVYHRGVKESEANAYVKTKFDEEELSDIISAHSFVDSKITLNHPDKDSVEVLRYNLRHGSLKASSFAGIYKNVLSRIRLANDLCDPRIFKELSKKKETIKFHPLKTINHRRKNWTPKLHITPSETSFLPPHESRLTFGKLKLKEAGKTEIDRFLEAVAVLGRTSKLNIASIKEFLRSMMERFTEAQIKIGFSDSIAEEISDALEKISYSKSVWWGLSYPRSDLFEWKLSPDVGDALKKSQQKNPAFMHRYGNYFVMILSYLQNKRGAFALDQLDNLWDAVRPWIMMQLGGTQSQKDMPKAKFNMQRVFSDLRERVECMDRLQYPPIPVFDEIRYGITADTHEVDQGEWPLYRWYIFEKAPYSKKLIAGCVQINKDEMDTQTIIPLDEQVEKAAESFSTELVRPIIIAKTSGISVLYEPRQDEYRFYDSEDLDYTDFEWRALGQLRYGTRHIGALSRLRWINTSYYAQFPEVDSESLPRRPSNITQDLFNHLERITSELSDVERVSVTVSGMSENGIIAFADSDGDECGTLRFDSLSRAISILRTPYDLGQPLVIDKTLATWNPTHDISYSSTVRQLEQKVLKGLF